MQNSEPLLDPWQQQQGLSQSELIRRGCKLGPIEPYKGIQLSQPQAGE